MRQLVFDTLVVVRVTQAAAFGVATPILGRGALGVGTLVIGRRGAVGLLLAGCEEPGILL